jgi:ubiquinol-cytochrome c reductase cytochrome c subunit
MAGDLRHGLPDPVNVSRLAALAMLSLGPTAALRLAAGGDTQPAPAQVDPVARGQELYAAGCASCHGPQGEGTVQGPQLVGVGPASVDFMVSTGRMPMADPADQPTRQRPAYSEEEIAAIVAYIASLGPGGQPIPQVDPAAGDLATGREVYAANCLACHGAGGQGASVGGGAVAPGLDVATPTQVAEAARIGPGVMPPFTQGQIPQHELDSLVRYVVSLREAVDRGGLGLGHVGPVVEGLVGWVIGLGLLLLVIRLTGSAR